MTAALTPVATGLRAQRAFTTRTTPAESVALPGSRADNARRSQAVSSHCAWAAPPIRMKGAGADAADNSKAKFDDDDLIQW